MVLVELNFFELEVNIELEKYRILYSILLIILFFIKSLILWFIKDIKKLIFYFII